MIVIFQRTLVTNWLMLDSWSHKFEIRNTYRINVMINIFHITIHNNAGSVTVENHGGCQSAPDQQNPIESLLGMLGIVPEPEHQTYEVGFEVPEPELVIDLLGEGAINDISNELYHRRSMQDLHQFMRGVEPLTADQIADLHYDHINLVDNVVEVMELFKKSYHELLNSGHDEGEIIEFIELSTMALIHNYGVSRYIATCAMVNFLAKLEEENHG